MDILYYFIDRKSKKHENHKNKYNGIYIISSSNPENPENPKERRSENSEGETQDEDDIKVGETIWIEDLNDFNHRINSILLSKFYN